MTVTPSSMAQATGQSHNTTTKCNGHDRSKHCNYICMCYACVYSELTHAYVYIYIYMYINIPIYICIPLNFM